MPIAVSSLFKRLAALSEQKLKNCPRPLSPRAADAVSARGAGIQNLVGRDLGGPYHFPALIQSFQALAAPFPGFRFSARAPAERIFKNALRRSLDA